MPPSDSFTELCAPKRQYQHRHSMTATAFMPGIPGKPPKATPAIDRLISLASIRNKHRFDLKFSRKTKPAPSM